MASLNELQALERRAERDWFDCLLRVDEMLRMRADEPGSGCHEALREAQNDVLVAGQRRVKLQRRIAALEGPKAELATWHRTDVQLPCRPQAGSGR